MVRAMNLFDGFQMIVTHDRRSLALIERSSQIGRSQNEVKRFKQKISVKKFR